MGSICGRMETQSRGWNNLRVEWSELQIQPVRSENSSEESSSDNGQYIEQAKKTMLLQKRQMLH